MLLQTLILRTQRPSHLQVTKPLASQSGNSLSSVARLGVILVLFSAVLVSIGPLTGAKAQDSRDYVYLVGPRTLYPYVAAVIDDFGEETRFKYPRIDTTNTEAGIKLLCAGAGFEYPDIATAVRPIKEEEKARCRRNDAGEVIEIKVGFDTVALAIRQESESFPLTSRALFLAIAKEIPDPEAADGGGPSGLAGQPIENPFDRWQEVDPALPDAPIKLVTPPRTDIAMDLLLGQLMMKGCREVEAFAALEEAVPSQFESLCTALREDMRVEESTAETKEIIAKVTAEEGTLALLRLFTIERYEEIRAIAIDGTGPSIEAINAEEYPGSRPVYLFIKRDHLEITPGLRDFVQGVFGERISGQNGFLTRIGLVPLSAEERSQVYTRATNIARPELPQEEIGPGEAEASPQARLNDVEIGLWESVRRSDNPEQVQTYLNLFPNGIYARAARVQVATLRRRDTDRDSVPDYQDKCAETPRGSSVDAQGCPIDSDGDGSFDGVDQCPDTPKNTPIDATGCPVMIDADNDGVVDQLDACPNTIAGAAVDGRGCTTNDSDGDGVTDGVDTCPDTPIGARVDANGCPSDSDGDGVADGLDQCDDTPAGANTDDRGCWVLRVTFGGGAATLPTEAFPVLNRAVQVLQSNPNLRVEVQGHSDSRGQRETNLRLSRERAQAVADYLVQEGIAASRLEVAGFGPDRPVATNNTAAGRALNRRVELVPLPGP